MFDDQVTLLEPATVTDRYTEEERVDWTQPPTEHLHEGEVQVVSSTEAVLTAGTVVQKARCWLPPEAAGYYGFGLYGVGAYAGSFSTKWRVRWDGDVFEVDGEVERKKVGGQVDHLHMWLKRVV